MFFIDIYVKTDGAWNKVNVQDGSKIKYVNQDTESGGDTMVNFTVYDTWGDPTTYHADAGMTWAEWIESEYCPGSGWLASFSNDYVTYYDDVSEFRLEFNSYPVPINDPIVNNGEYYLVLDGPSIEDDL